MGGLMSLQEAHRTSEETIMGPRLVLSFIGEGRRVKGLRRGSQETRGAVAGKSKRNSPSGRLRIRIYNFCMQSSAVFRGFSHRQWVCCSLFTPIAHTLHF